MPLVLLTAGSALADANDLELAVKATYLVKFGAFVEWPPQVFPSANSPFYLCVAGAYRLGSLLERAAAGQRIVEHPIAVRRLDAVTGNSGCQILFVGAGVSPTIGAALDAVRGMPVLTVTDLPPDAPRKGIVDFVEQEGHVRFAINEPEASADGLRISSQLAALAVNMRLR